MPETRTRCQAGCAFQKCYTYGTADPVLALFGE